MEVRSTASGHGARCLTTFLARWNLSGGATSAETKEICLLRNKHTHAKRGSSTSQHQRRLADHHMVTSALTDERLGGWGGEGSYIREQTVSRFSEQEGRNKRKTPTPRLLPTNNLHIFKCRGREIAHGVRGHSGSTRHLNCFKVRQCANVSSFPAVQQLSSLELSGSHVTCILVVSAHQ